MENDLKGNENYFELTGGSSYGGFELPVVDCELIVFTVTQQKNKLETVQWKKPRK